MTTVLETCRIPPPAGIAADLTVPLSFFDLFWLHSHPIRHLIFYDHPCSELEFLNTIVPKLKQSLSLSLKHHLPVAANLYYPSHTDKNKPIIRYVSGDSVPLTIAVSGQDFDELAGNHARDSDQFYDFMPEMPPIRDEGEYKLVPLVALQVTLFPGSGICIGLSNHHCLGDGRSVVCGRGLKSTDLMAMKSFCRQTANLCRFSTDQFLEIVVELMIYIGM